MAEDKGKEEEKFDFTPEGEGYISLDEARVVAMQTASSVPGDYGRSFRGVAMVFEVASLEETDDFYEVTLSFRPQGNFDGTPGQEQFFIGKEGTIAFRQVHSFPTQTSASPTDTKRRGGFPVIPVAVGLVVVGVIAVVGAVFALSGSGGDSGPVAAVPPTETPAPIEPTVNIEKVEAAAQQGLAVSATSAPPTPTFTPMPVPPPIARVTVVPPTPTPSPRFSPPVFVTKVGRAMGWEGGTYYPSGDGVFRYPAGVSVGPYGGVYVVEPFSHRIQRFTAEGVFVSTWGKDGRGEGEFNHPEGIAVSSDGSVYVADTQNNLIQKFTAEGTFVTRWGTNGSDDEQFKWPKGIAVGPYGAVYVADTFNYRIQKFTAEGVFVSTWGKYGRGEGEFNRPEGIAVSSDGSVYVGDTRNDSIQKFTAEGTFVTRWGTSGIGEGKFFQPKDIAVSSDGSVHVADYRNKRIQKFTADGVFVGEWGAPEWPDRGQYQSYIGPMGIATGPYGSLYVADTRVILKFKNR